MAGGMVKIKIIFKYACLPLCPFDKLQNTVVFTKNRHLFGGCATFYGEPNHLPNKAILASPKLVRFRHPAVVSREL
jgi:hypothetical protein